MPAEYGPLFASRGARVALASHRGYDIGALRLARRLGRRLGVVPISSTVTRLLVDLNRSIGHATLFSEFSDRLDANARERILTRHYFPYRERVESEVRRHLDAGRDVLHLSVHSFTPRLKGRTRTADVGLLYDPRSERERRLCARWREILRKLQSDWYIRRNYPYLGRSDALTTHLRQRLPRDHYLGVELEVKQSLIETDGARGRRIAEVLGESLERLFARGTADLRSLVPQDTRPQ